MTQLTFADAEYADKRTQTRCEVFLAEMDRVAPWTALGELIEPHGRRPYPLATMLLHFLQKWSALSDPAMEEDRATASVPAVIAARPRRDHAAQLLPRGAPWPGGKDADDSQRLPHQGTMVGATIIQAPGSSALASSIRSA